MKSIRALLVTDQGERAASLSLGAGANGGEPELVVDGVVIAPADFPAGAYLKVADPEMADLAVLAGYATEPPRTARRRRYRNIGRVYAVLLMVAAVGSLYWAVRDLLELDLLGALAWIGLGLFCGVLGLGWWYAGEETGLDEAAHHRQFSRQFWRGLKGMGRRPKR